MTYHIISAHPDSVSSYLESSLIGRAVTEGVISIHTYDLREYTEDKHKKVDDRPYGGGPGMVLSAQPVISAIEDALTKVEKPLIVFFSPHGDSFSNEMADEIRHAYTDIVFVCGHYEGVDARVKEVFEMRDISIGGYVLTGGELPALVMIDAITRRLDGVLGNVDSVEEKRVAGKDSYTRPECFEYKGKEYCVPEVLKSGNHKEIDEFRKGG